VVVGAAWNSLARRVSRERPNLLTLIALVYRARRKLPQGRTMLFSLIAEAYLDSIDQARGIQATPYSYDQQRHWLSLIAYRMQQQRQRSRLAATVARVARRPTQAILVPRAELQRWLAEAMKNSLETLGLKIDANEEAAKYLKVVARRSGLLLPRGQYGDDNLYAFQHLSLQDYFASQFIAENVLRPRWIDKARQNATIQPDDLEEVGGERHLARVAGAAVRVARQTPRLERNDAGADLARGKMAHAAAIRRGSGHERAIHSDLGGYHNICPLTQIAGRGGGQRL
jgi:hypothetical protein